MIDRLSCRVREITCFGFNRITAIERDGGGGGGDVPYYLQVVVFDVALFVQSDGMEC